MLDNPYIKNIVIYFHDDTLRKKANDALKESEKRFRNLISDLKIGVVLHNKNAETVMCNKAMASILKTSEEELLGKSIFSIASNAIHEDGRNFIMEERPLYLALQTKSPTKDVVMGVHLAKTKKRVWLMISCTPVLDENDEILHVVSSVHDITERKLLEQNLIAGQINHQKQLTQATIDGQENERREIGKELHDNIGQQLTTVKLFLDMAKTTSDATDNDMLAMALKGIGDVINEVRSMSRSLVPSTLKDLGLIDTIYELTDSINSAQSLKINVEYFGFDEDCLPENKKLMLFRIVQEQLNNIIRHAKASLVWISIKTCDEHLCLEIKDNGQGFDPGKIKKGLGFTNIGNRAGLFGGKVNVDSSAGEGCSVKVCIPHTMDTLV